MRVQGLGFRVLGLGRFGGFRVSGWFWDVWVLGFRAWGFGFGLVCRVWGFRCLGFQALGCGV